MAVYMVPGVFGVGGQILDSNGKVVSGALVNVYAAGTVSTVNTFKDSLGAVTASNPIVTNSDGRLPNEMWQTGGTAIKIVLTDALANTLGTYDNLTGINDPTTLLTTTNNWTAQQNFNTVGVTTLNVSTLSVVSVTAGVVPLGRVLRTQTSATGSSKTISSSTNSLMTLNLGTVNAGDRLLVQTVISGTKGVTTGDVEFILQKSSGTAVIAFGDVSASANKLLPQVAPATFIVDSWFALVSVSTGGTLILDFLADSQGSNVATATPQMRVLVLNNG